jgi:hypothetical protein
MSQQHLPDAASVTAAVTAVKEYRGEDLSYFAVVAEVGHNLLALPGTHNINRSPVGRQPVKERERHQFAQTDEVVFRFVHPTPKQLRFDDIFAGKGHPETFSRIQSNLSCPHSGGTVIMPERRLLIRALVAGAVLVGATVPSAAAVAAPAPSGQLHLSISAGTPPGQGRTAMLNCGPPGGDHPHAAQACADLEAADGHFNAIQGDNHVCPMIYRPVTAQATGTWEGRQIDFSATYPNECQLQTSTGAVFQF